MFAYRSEINELPCNYGNKTECEIGCNSQIMNNKEHLNNCPQINVCENTMNLTKLLNGSNKEELKVLQKIQENNIIRIDHLRDSV